MDDQIETIRNLTYRITDESRKLRELTEYAKDLVDDIGASLTDSTTVKDARDMEAELTETLAHMREQGKKVRRALLQKRSLSRR